MILSIYAYDGYIFLRRFLSVFIKKKPQKEEVTSQVEVPSLSQNPEEKKEETSDNENIDSTDTTVNPPEISPDQVNEEEIYADYVALVDETHAEKEQEARTIKEEESINFDADIVNPEKTAEEIPEVPKDFQEEEEVLENKEKKDEDEGEVGEDHEEISKEEEPVENTNEELKEKVIDEENVGIPEETEPISETPDTLEIVEIPEPESVEVNESNQESVSTSIDEDTQKIPEPTPNESQVYTPSESGVPSKNNSETIFALLNNIRTLIARGQITEARVLIIQ